MTFEKSLPELEREWKFLTQQLVGDQVKVTDAFMERLDAEIDMCDHQDQWGDALENVCRHYGFEWSDDHDKFIPIE